MQKLDLHTICTYIIDCNKKKQFSLFRAWPAVVMFTQHLWCIYYVGPNSLEILVLDIKIVDLASHKMIAAELRKKNPIVSIIIDIRL